MGEDAEVAVEITVFGQRMSSPIDTAATSTWVDEEWFEESVGQVKPTRRDACAADGREIQVAGVGVLEFQMQRIPFSEEVRVMSTLLDKILIGKGVWRTNRLQLDLERNSASILQFAKRIQGPLVRNSPKWDKGGIEAVQAVI